MNIVTLGVSSTADARHRLAAAFQGKPQGAHISFVSVELLWKVLTTKRWELLKIMAGQGKLTIREVARRAGRDIKAVHADVHALLDAGVIDRAPTGGVIFPYDGVHVDFVLKVA